MQPRGLATLTHCLQTGILGGLVAGQMHSRLLPATPCGAAMHAAASASDAEPLPACAQHIEACSMANSVNS